ncbi:PucR family transcriptional regulator [Nocardioides terrisoli]|uniref:PucR family transcriptional regulator n=1 Tax=Nocardioides terrisoli TaxID=3388267 RepID=UPI00287BA497|nr:helix-turn-helix domain-containing protein [Nocardioides marmorisolisilvae]
MDPSSHPPATGPAPEPVIERMLATYAAMPTAAQKALTVIAGTLESSSNEIARVMVAGYVEEIPEYAAITDQGLLADVQAVSAALVRCWLRMLRTGDPADPELMQQIQEGARRRAAQGMDLSALLRAYRLGVRSMWTQLTQAPDWRTSASLRKSSALITGWVLDYSDLLCTQVESCFLEEATRTAQQKEYRRSALLNVILASSSAESANRLVELGRPHLIVVVDTATDRTMTQLEELGHALEKSISALLWTVRHSSLVAAVPAGSSDQRALVRGQLEVLASRSEELRIGLGGAAYHAHDSRESYLEATDALRVGPLVGPRGDVYDYLDLAPLVEMLRRPERAQRFVTATLEPFSRVAARTWALPTLEAYLEHRGSQRDVAAHLDIHVNTLKYRLNELRSCGQEYLDSGAAAENVLLALRLRHALGTTDAPRRRAVAEPPRAQVIPGRQKQSTKERTT